MEAAKGNGTSGPPDPVVSDNKLLQDGRWAAVTERGGEAAVEGPHPCPPRIPRPPQSATQLGITTLGHRGI